jgi:hypothetical protein
MTKVSHRSRLVRQIRRAFTLGVPGIVLGLVATAGALWLGLDYTGIALLATGVLLTAMGVFLVAVGLYCSALLLEGWLRGRLSRSTRPGKTAIEPPPDHAPVLPPAPAAPSHGPDSFRIF